MPRKPTTRFRGEGSIYRSDYRWPGSGVTVERWIASFDVGVAANGKLRQPHAHPRSRDQARRRRAPAERRLKLGPHWTTDPRWVDLVITSEVGTPVDPSHARRDFKKVCAQAGVPALSLYEMRHTVASLMVDADVQLREVADLLGHKDLERV